MEREGNAAAVGSRKGRREAAPSDEVIVLPAGSAAARQQSPAAHHQPRRDKELPAGAGVLGAFVVPEPPEKVFYKTKLCEKFESGGRCAYEDSCTFAHGHAELRPPLPLPPGVRRSRLAVPPVDGADGGGRAFHYYFPGKVCFEFRDKGTCHFGEKCNYSHASAAVHPAEMRYAEPARRNATPTARAFAPGSSGYAATGGAMAFYPPGPDAAEQGEGKPTRLELLSRKKMSGIYGDWPEEF